jgi:hypothetical protein
MTPAWARSLAYLTGQGIEALVLLVAQRVSATTDTTLFTARLDGPESITAGGGARE